MKEAFDNIILVGRPASGKSELIDFIKSLSLPERMKRFHIGAFKEMDDFLWVWEIGEHDDLWEQLGKPRLHTINVGHGYTAFDSDSLYDGFLNLKINRELMTNYAANDEFYAANTLFVEFARGGERGYSAAFGAMDPSILKRSAILFINNSWEESMRRNQERFEAKKANSILAHKTPDKEMNVYYRHHDWDRLTGGKDEGHVDFHGIKIPFVNVKNEPVTTDYAKIAARFEAPINKLWELYSGK